jgi:hypothetical protein
MLASTAVPATEPGRTLAECHDYSQLLAALRARADELAVSRETIDYAAGFQSGWAGKCMALTKIKSTLGPQTLGPLLTVLGLRLDVVEDDQRVASRLEKRDMRAVRVPTLGKRKRRHYPKLGPAWGKRMAALRTLTLSRRERSRIARKAAIIRWKDVKAAMAELQAKRNGGPKR